MTIVTNTSVSRSGSVTSASATPKTNMDYDSFLQLFMAQMKNQDPTKPNDPTETLSQLASFSSVEQAIKLNAKLDSLLSASNASLASAIVGKEVGSLDGSVSGVVASVTISESELVATLQGGKTLNLAEGYRIGAA